MGLTSLGTTLLIIFTAIVYWAGFGFGYLTGKFAERGQEKNENV